MKSVSVLSQDFIENMLRIAQENLARDGSLLTIVFLKLDDGRVSFTGIPMPEMYEDRRSVMQNLRQQVRDRGEDIREALVLMHSWFVGGADAAGGLHMPPSQHPHRQEAIIAIGRNAEHSRASMVVQPYERKEAGSFVWVAPVVAQYDLPTDESNQVVGLVDDLFIPQGVH